MVITINGKAIAPDEVLSWEEGRKSYVVKRLVRLFRIPKAEYTLDELAALKRGISDDEMRRKLKSKIAICTVGTVFLNALCCGKRKSSVAEIDLPGIDAKTVYDGYFDVMINNTEENLLLGVRANPDHYLLRGMSDNRQEVIECTGAIPFPSRFIIHYGNEKGLHSKADADYPYQAVGVCCLANGTPIGGVRHQMKDTNTGTHIRLEVEFPEALPKKILAQHQLHLACEFTNWFGAILRRNRYVG
mgnify:CR=1 FL=1